MDIEKMTQTEKEEKVIELLQAMEPSEMNVFLIMTVLPVIPPKALALEEARRSLGEMEALRKLGAALTEKDADDDDDDKNK